MDITHNSMFVLRTQTADAFKMLPNFIMVVHILVKAGGAYRVTYNTKDMKASETVNMLVKDCSLETMSGKTKPLRLIADIITVEDIFAVLSMAITKEKSHV